VTTQDIPDCIREHSNVLYLGVFTLELTGNRSHAYNASMFRAHSLFLPEDTCSAFMFCTQLFCEKEATPT